MNVSIRPSRRELLAGMRAGADRRCRTRQDCLRAGGNPGVRRGEDCFTAVLRGARTGNLTTFKGIPYGGSVSGANRFKAAPPLKPWDGVRDALAFGAPRCSRASAATNRRRLRIACS